MEKQAVHFTKVTSKPDEIMLERDFDNLQGAVEKQTAFLNMFSVQRGR